MTKQRKILKQSLPDVIANDVRERILSGELSEGETIRQGALAEEYDVSRMPVREALNRLGAEGLVRVSNNRGATVIKHSLREIGEIFDLRILIEVDMFRRAISKMTTEHIAECHKVLDEMEASYEANDVAKWGALNFQYHSALYAAAERNLTNELLHKVNLQSDRYVRIHLSVMHKLDSAIDEHRQLLLLAENQELEKACELLANHIIRTKDQLLAMIAEKRNDKKS